jgi:two-component system response regulator YesN
MPHTITIFADSDIVSAIERCEAERYPAFTIRHKAVSYYDCFEPTVQDHIDILIMQVKSPIALAQDLMYELQCANYSPVILLFELQDGGRLRYTTSDQGMNPLTETVSELFVSALSGMYTCKRASFRTTLWDDSVQSFAEKAGRSESLREILRGCSEEEFLVYRERYGLDLKERGYFLFIWELMDLEYNNHRFYKDIYNFNGEVLVGECRDTIGSYNGGEVFYSTLNRMCIILNDLNIKSEAKRLARFEETIKKLTVYTGCKTARLYLSDRIESFNGLREAFDLYCIKKPLAFFLRDVRELRPSLPDSRKKLPDMETVDTILHEITNYIRYDILNPLLPEALHRLYYDILKPSMSYTFFYAFTAAIYYAMAEAQDFQIGRIPAEIGSPGQLQFSSIEEQYEMLLGQIRELQAGSDDKRQTRSSLVLKAVDYITANYNSDISVTDIANALYINNVYLSQIFKKKMGVSVIKYLINYRIEQAKKLLVETDDLIYIVSEAVGFHEFRHFSKTFKKITGLSPAQYRKQKR